MIHHIFDRIVGAHMAIWLQKYYRRVYVMIHQLTGSHSDACSTNYYEGEYYFAVASVSFEKPSKV